MLDRIGQTVAATHDPTAPSRRAAQDAARQWRDLRLRLQGVTPRGAARAALVVGTIGFIGWAALASWPALAPFIIGGLIAYGLLPVVDRLDRFMPRALAATVSVVAVLAVLVGIVVTVAPPLANGIGRVAAELPRGDQISASLEQFSASLGTQPGVGAAAGALLGGLAGDVRDFIATAPQHASELAGALAASLLGAIGALIGLLVLPTWILTVLSQKERAREAADRRLAPWLRDDAWAAFRIADRAMGSYVRGYVVVAALVGLFTWLGLRLSPRLGGPEFDEPLALAVLTGATQLIPAIGPLLGFVPALLLAPIAPDRAATFLASYLVARVAGANLVGARYQTRALGVHPAIMVPGIVMLGQFGLGWLFLSAPLVAIAHDLVRYAHGRLSEPPLPAGVLPGAAPVRSAAPAGAASAAYLRPAAPRPFRRASSGSTAAQRSTG